MSNIPQNLQDASVIYLLAAIDRGTGQIDHVFVKRHRYPTHRGDNWAFVEITQFPTLNDRSAAEVMLSFFRPASWLDWTFKFMSDRTKEMLGIEEIEDA